MIKLLSYFSYKGGSGRSSLAYNSIPFIADQLEASPEHPILVLDADIDSAGLTFLLLNGEIDSSKHYVVQDLLHDLVPGMTETPESCPIEKHPFFGKLYKVGNQFGLSGERGNASILFIPAELGEDTINFDQAMTNFMDLTAIADIYGCKAVIFDTPAGKQLTTRLALDATDRIITCMRITYQFRQGTFDFLRRRASAYDGKKFIIVPNAVPQEEIKIGDSVFNRESVKQEIIKRVGELGIEADLSMLEGDHFGVPEVKRFKIQEDILYRLNRDGFSPDEAAAYEEYKHLADIVSAD